MPASVRRWRDFLLTEVDAAHSILGPWHVLASLPPEEFTVRAKDELKRLRATDRLNPLIARQFAEPPASIAEAAQLHGKAFAAAEEQPNAPGAAELREFLRDANSPTVVPDTSIVNNELFFPTSVVDELWKLQGEVERRLIELNAPAALVLADRPPEPNPR
ncbi:MAG: hypothetical protein HC814_07115, partial [Rhodobacteraceae bacterium]|nr:hypothetical protein [Paracoccaceae bacterium]